MKRVVAAMLFTLPVLLAGCNGSRPTHNADPPEVEPPQKPGEPPKQPLDPYDPGPWIEYDDPAFTAVFPSKTEPPRRDEGWEQIKKNTMGTDDVRVVGSKGGGMVCLVTVYPTLLLPEAWEKDPDSQLSTYVSDKAPSLKKLLIEGKFPARQTVAPSALPGGKQVYRVVYAYKRMYVLDLNSPLIQSEEDPRAKKFFDSFKPKE